MPLLLLTSLLAGQGGDVAAIGAVLDDLHRAAAAADEARYFAHFAPDAVFLGTDPGERWTLGAFRRYAHPHFSQGKGWTYVPRPGRHVTVEGELAWFDEILDSARYGACRGTGVLRRVDGEWRVAQYSLTFLVPNRLAGRVTALTRGAVP